MLQRILPPLEILTIIGFNLKMEHPATDAGIEVERLIMIQPNDSAACYTSTPVSDTTKVIGKPRRARSIS